MTRKEFLKQKKEKKGKKEEGKTKIRIKKQEKNERKGNNSRCLWEYKQVASS